MNEEQNNSSDNLISDNLRAMLNKQKKQPDDSPKPKMVFKPKTEKSEEALALNSISWHLKRIADAMEYRNLQEFDNEQ